MNVFRIAWRSIQQRGVASLLTTISMALGVMLVVAVLSIHGVISKSFRGNSSLGYNMIVGARGGKLQLTLNSVYYLSQPVENVPYEYYLAFRDSEVRRSEMENSVAYRTHLSQWNANQLQEIAMPSLGMGGISDLAASLTWETLRQADDERMGLDDEGMYSDFTGMALPLCLGDYFGDFRVVGTTPEFFELMEIEPGEGPGFHFAQGRNFEHFNEQHGYYECVVGSAVAREMKVSLNYIINPTHGAPDGDIHRDQFTVVGILEPSGTPNDRAVFVNMEGFFLIEEHAKPIDLTEEDEDDGFGFKPSQRPQLTLASHPPDAGKDDQQTQQIFVEPLPIEQREVTAVLVRTEDDFGMVSIYIENGINEGKLENTLDWSDYRPRQAQRSAQAVLPIREIEGLFMIIVRPVQLVLLVLTVMICIVSGISILVSMYNSMAERRHEIAVMRALGANRTKVMTIILIEAILLAAGGGLAGWVAGHSLNVAVSPYVEAQTGVSLKFTDFAPSVEILSIIGIDNVRISPEWALIPALMLLAVIVGFYPALSAYRTDVSKSLGK